MVKIILILIAVLNGGWMIFDGTHVLLKVKTDLNDNVVRSIGLMNNLVDIKVCAVDEIWSGLKFVY